VALISQGKFKEALALVRQTLPFPGILAYACAHPCERECKRIEEDRPISICDLKRFLVDHGEESEFEFSPPEERSQKIAIIGSGPSGLTAAYDLRQKGYRVTLFESQSEMGGLLTHGFPSYRLPRKVIEKDLAVIENMGIEVRLKTEVGKDISPETLLQSFNAIYLAVGMAGAESMTRVFKGLKRTRRGTVKADPVTLETGLKGVFAGGDLVNGPGTMIDSMAQGRKAAISIDRYLRGEDLLREREWEESQISPLRSTLPASKREEREIPPDMVRPLREGLTAKRRWRKPSAVLAAGVF
jgi:NADPH-dependent glutamate synthase beta subunit-like oxidoreductase